MVAFLFLLRRRPPKSECGRPPRAERGRPRPLGSECSTRPFNQNISFIFGTRRARRPRSVGSGEDARAPCDQAGETPALLVYVARTPLLSYRYR
jgi:hypothetical protein